MKPKEWLVKNGHLDSIKRGRLSLDHVRLIEDAVRNGVNIEGYGIAPSTVPVERATAQVKREKVTNEKVIEELGPIFYPLNEYVVFERVGGKKVMRSLREVCNNCRVSLVQCHCGAPVIVARSLKDSDGDGSVRVYIERAK